VIDLRVILVRYTKILVESPAQGNSSVLIFPSKC
jgi:hypothetical protein